MGAILITGTSGLVGKALAESLSKNHEVIGLSRRAGDLPVPFVQGDFQEFEDLRQLDKYEIDAVCHLAAVTGGCSERDGLEVNVEGTRRFMRYLFDRGCRKYVLASSVAAVGFRARNFKPLTLPFPDDHPCLADDAYGLSKRLMEEVAAYFARQDDAMDVTAIRLSGLRADGNPDLSKNHQAPSIKAIGPLTLMPVSEVCRLIGLILEKPAPGFRIVNTAWPKSRTATPVAELLKKWYGDSFDCSFYERPGHEFDPVFAIDRVRELYGFEPRM